MSSPIERLRELRSKQSPKEKRKRDIVGQAKDKALEGKRGEGKVAKGKETKFKGRDDKDPIKRFKLA